MEDPIFDSTVLRPQHSAHIKYLGKKKKGRQSIDLNGFSFIKRRASQIKTSVISES